MLFPRLIGSQSSIFNSTIAIYQLGYSTQTRCLNWINFLKQFKWLIDWWIFILFSRGSNTGAILWSNPHPLRSWQFSTFSSRRLTSIFPRKFAACSKPPSRGNHRKASYPRTLKRDQGGGWTPIIVVKTTLLPSRPRCWNQLWNIKTGLQVEF